jgi:3-methyladenine DNA glycosylase AlkC
LKHNCSKQKMGETKRKGARSISEIPLDILQQLNAGQIETANLMEWLAINQKELLENALKQLKRQEYLQLILTDVASLKKQTVNTVNEAIGKSLFTQSFAKKDSEFLVLLSNHTSDSARCWGAYAVSANKTLRIKDVLKQIQPFAADKHFGVREIAWLAVRESIASNLEESIKLLSLWATQKDENIRRFASEATRPRGVWCAHIEKLKQHPELALPILEPLKSDSAKYVQDSVGNWLNDASKTQEKFVVSICKRWQKESNTKETMYIIKKALRTLKK